MLRNYLLIAFRSVRKSRAHALVNIAGLALGITCSIVIFLIVRSELSYDNYHAEEDQIFRVVTTFTKSATQFLAGLFLTLVISMLTVGYRSIRAARQPHRRTQN